MEDFFLPQAKPGIKYTIVKVSDSLSTKNKMRLLELGFLQNRQITLLKKSMLKKTLLIEISGYVLSLRSDIAQGVIIKK